MSEPTRQTSETSETSEIPETDLPPEAAAAYHDIRRHWKWYLAEGLALVVVGVLAILLPPLSTLAVGLAFGAVLAIAGLFKGARAVTHRRLKGAWWSMAISALYVVAGAALVVFPGAGVLTLTIVVAALFLAEGLLGAYHALTNRDESGWGWALASAAAAVILGGLIGLGLPGTAVWVLGLLVGINFLIAGMAQTMTALAVRTYFRNR